MTSTPEVKQPVEEIKVLSDAELAQRLLSAKYPERSGFKRKIIPLWDCYYRINYHNYLDGKIESVFVSVIGEVIKEFEEKKKEPV